jgi:hypothetical protein
MTTMTTQRAHKEICNVNEPQLLSALVYVTECVLQSYISARHALIAFSSALTLVSEPQPKTFKSAQCTINGSYF